MEDDFPFPGVYSQVLAVNLPGCTLAKFNKRNLKRIWFPSSESSPGSFWAVPFSGSIRDFLREHGGLLRLEFFIGNMVVLLNPLKMEIYPPINGTNFIRFMWG